MVDYDDKILEIPIKDVMIGDRIRKNFCDVDSLMLSLSHKGQLEPIQVQEPVKGHYELVNGHQRILALTKLGHKTVRAIKYCDMDKVEAFEIELELCVRRSQLSYAEEAKALKDLVEMKRKKGMNGLGCSARLTQRDIAEQIGVTESHLSESLRIANALEENPGVEVHFDKRSHFLRALRSGTLATIASPSHRIAFEESFLVCTTDEMLSRSPDKSIDLFIAHPDKPTSFDTEVLYKKLKYGGQVLIFCDMMDFLAWQQKFTEVNLNTRKQPMMWNIKGESKYCPVLWAGKSREQPNRMMKDSLEYNRQVVDPNLMKTKPYNLMSYLIKCCTERSGYVVLADCENLDGIRCCMDQGRSVRACNPDRVTKERVFLNLDT